jgi:hypothetical protein
VNDVEHTAEKLECVEFRLFVARERAGTGLRGEFVNSGVVAR